MIIKKNDEFELEIESVSLDGNGVGRYNGIVIFVSGTAKGDRIICHIIKVTKSYAVGVIKEILNASEQRIDDNCTVSKKCGGCCFRHIDYKYECQLKEQAVKDSFERIGKIQIQHENILPCDNIERYRNKAVYPVGFDGEKAYVGFFANHSHRVIKCDDCKIGPEIFTKILKDIIDIVNTNKISIYDESTEKGLLRHIFLRKGEHTDEIMVCLIVTKPNIEIFNPIFEHLIKKYENIKSCVLNINSKKTNVLLGEKCIDIYGEGYITDIMCGNKIHISPLSFYQVNTLQAEKLYSIAENFANINQNTVLLDLYCGAGTIGLSMAKKIKKLIGGEIVPQAIENAKTNAEINNITNAKFYCGDAGKIATEILNDKTKIDVIIIDPPRKGCDELTLNSISKISPNRIVMVSCNPSTAARDASILENMGYKTCKIQAVDMFPRTSHVETVYLLSKKA